MSGALMAAIEKRATEMLGTDERAASAICYVLWVMQVAPPFNEDYFMLRVRGCQRQRQWNREFDKAVGDLVTYAIHFKERS
jgi:hypothetical protein